MATCCHLRGLLSRRVCRHRDLVCLIIVMLCGHSKAHAVVSQILSGCNDAHANTGISSSDSAAHAAGAETLLRAWITACVQRRDILSSWESSSPEFLSGLTVTAFVGCCGALLHAETFFDVVSPGLTLRCGCFDSDTVLPSQGHSWGDCHSTHAVSEPFSGSTLC